MQDLHKQALNTLRAAGAAVDRLEQVGLLRGAAGQNQLLQLRYAMRRLAARIDTHSGGISLARLDDTGAAQVAADMQARLALRRQQVQSDSSL